MSTVLSKPIDSLASKPRREHQEESLVSGNLYIYI